MHNNVRKHCSRQCPRSATTALTPDSSAGNTQIDAEPLIKIFPVKACSLCDTIVTEIISFRTCLYLNMILCRNCSYFLCRYFHGRDIHWLNSHLHGILSCILIKINKRDDVCIYIALKLLADGCKSAFMIVRCISSGQQDRIISNNDSFLSRFAVTKAEWHG